MTNDGYVYGQSAGTAQNEGSDVFGQPRLPSGAADATWGANDVTRRRYINQEDLLDAHLIDLNARLYDPLLGKFLSPDPVIANQDDSQSWNAYAYSHNNPMSGEDPTGLLDCNTYAGRCEQWTSGSDDAQQAKSQTITVTPGGEVAQLIHSAAGGDSTAAKKLWAAGVTGFSDGSASYELQASISSSVSDASFGRPYQVAANTTAGKVVGALAQVATDLAGQIPIAGAEVGTEGAQTPAVPTEEITVFAAGRAAKEAAGDATDALVESLESSPRTASRIDRSAFKLQREAYWKSEASNNPSNYTPDDLARMRTGRAPIGPDGSPMELHHVDRTPEGGLQPLSRTDHRLGPNYKLNHPD